MSQVDEIGRTAGEVWAFLKTQGKTSVSAVDRGVGAPRRQVHMAIGWLAREGKVLLAEEKGGLQIWLMEG